MCHLKNYISDATVSKRHSASARPQRYFDICTNPLNRVDIKIKRITQSIEPAYSEQRPTVSAQ
jgi:hypothetical protein